MRCFCAVSILLGSLVIALPARAQSTLSPGVSAALQQLSSDDFARREKAVGQLQQALAEEIQAIALTRDPEAQARVVELLRFDQGLARWAESVMKLPRDQQEAAFALGLKPEILPQLVKLYSDDSGVRLDGVRELRKNPDEGVTDLLARPIGDTEQAVYIAAMEGVWDRKATAAVVDALWYRAVQAQMATFNPGQEQPGRITFRGRPISALSSGDNTLYQRAQDNAVATEVLLHLNPPELAPRLKAFFEQVQTAYRAAKPPGRDAAPPQDLWMYLPTQESMRNAIRMAGAAKPKDLVPGLFQIITGPVLQTSAGQINRQAYFWSNRTWAIALFLQITGDTPDAWSLRYSANLSGMWIFPGQADENAAIVKLREWWSQNAEKWGGDPKAATSPAPEVPQQVVPQPMPRDLPMLR